VGAMALTVLKTPVRCPQANAFGERLIGTVRRECLDWLIALNERHLRCVLREWVGHYNQARPHTSLGLVFPTYRSTGGRNRAAISSLMRDESLPLGSLEGCIMNITCNQ
jgi:transposase InsO family protein